MSEQNEWKAIGELIRTQDNRATMNPMFCVQIKVRDVGFDSAYFDTKCWRDSANDETIYDDDPGFTAPPEGDEWEEFGYRDRWETVMVAFTEKGCEEYLELNGHNDRRRAHNGEVRIYVESFNRCPEMIKIREHLLNTRADHVSDERKVFNTVEEMVCETMPKSVRDKFFELGAAEDVNQVQRIAELEHETDLTAEPDPNGTKPPSHPIQQPEKKNEPSK